jgi:colanic acid biosynthesis glycosyl transferase WcaI
MHILYLSQYFPPEVGATQTRAHEMAQGLTNAGHQVTVITEFPNHPKGIILPAYRGKIYERTYLNRIEVIRVWVKTSTEKRSLNRLAFYLSYMVHAILAGIFLARGPYDLIYASSPPLFVGGTALALSYLRRVPLVFEVRDLWPESAVALGEIKNPTAIALATKLEEACYRRSEATVVVTQGILDRLVERGVPPSKLAFIPNGANIELFQFQPEGRTFIRKALGLGDQFVVIYAGILGVAQGLDTLLQAARLLQGDHGIHFLMVGEGPKKAELMTRSEKYGLSNLTFIPEQPRELMPRYLSAADVALIPLRNIDLFKRALPSKIFDVWACERPIILSVEGEARHVLEQAHGGLFVPPEDALTLIKSLKSLKGNPSLRDEMGKKGRLFVVKHYSRKEQAAQLDELLERIALKRHGSDNTGGAEAR